ncbi:unnamed protein product [Choristocarpus tenellus]
MSRSGRAPEAGGLEAVSAGGEIGGVDSTSSPLPRSSCSPHSSCGSRGSFEPSSGGGFEAFMEALVAMSPQDEPSSLTSAKRQVDENGVNGCNSLTTSFPLQDGLVGKGVGCGHNMRKRRAPLEERLPDAYLGHSSRTMPTSTVPMVGDQERRNPARSR